MRVFVISLLLCGCASLKTEVMNRPDIRVIGNKVEIMMLDQNGAPSFHPLALKVKESAAEWLKRHGYEVETNGRLANTVLVFSTNSSSKTYYVPGQTYTKPVYNMFQQPRTYTSQITSSSGANLGSVQTQEVVDPLQPVGYQTNYREGFYSTATWTALTMEVMKQEHGHTPTMISKGSSGFEEADKNILSDYRSAYNAVFQMLDRSLLGNASKESRSIVSNGDPGCWKRLGIGYDNKGRILQIEKESGAQQAGLKPGDVLKVVEGQVFDVWVRSNPDFHAASDVTVTIERNQAEKEIKLPLKMTCRI